MNSIKNGNKIFYLLSFLEGAAVMAAELAGAKMMAPFFGSSLAVWASVLGITLGGLGAGYFAGGFLSERTNPAVNLYRTLLCAAVFMILMPYSAAGLMAHTSSFPLTAAVVISDLVFLFPPVFLMGMVSPLLIKSISSGTGTGQPGRVAGNVFAVSTSGGILSTFLFGFYLVPQFGLSWPVSVTGVLLGIIPFFKLISPARPVYLLFPVSVVFSFAAMSTDRPPGPAKILYAGEGMMGQVVVADYPLAGKGKKPAGFKRVLFVNRSAQSVAVYQDDTTAFFDYVGIVAAEAGRGEKKKALILGLGGGNVARQLYRQGWRVDAVELDARIYDCAKKLFGLQEEVNVAIDDARHYLLNREQEIYDLIVLDAFVGEVNPHHLFTAEFFSVVRKYLSAEGKFIVNGNGFWSGAAGKGMRSVGKTLLASGFDAEVVPTAVSEAGRNLLFVCTKASGRPGTISGRGIRASDLEGDIVLADEKPVLELLNAEANRTWREAYRNYFLDGYFSGQDAFLFK